jgi:hypothetical protein
MRQSLYKIYAPNRVSREYNSVKNIASFSAWKFFKFANDFSF